MSFILRFGLGKNGDWAIGGAPMMRRMSVLDGRGICIWVKSTCMGTVMKG